MIHHGFDRDADDDVDEHYKRNMFEANDDDKDDGYYEDDNGDDE